MNVQYGIGVSVSLKPTASVIGTGKIDDPVREIAQYWSLDGKLLATVDEFISSKEENEKNKKKSC